MQNLLTVALQVGILFALMSVGAICRKLKQIDESSVKGMVNVLLMVVTPCLIISVFQRKFDPAMMRSFATAFVIAFMAHIVMIIISSLISRGNEKSLPVLKVATVFSNAGFMGIPLEQALLGDEGVFYGVVYVVMFNLFMWSWGLSAMKDTGGKLIFPKINRMMFFNPGTIGIAIGVPLFLFSVELPQVLKSPVDMLADLNTPLAMLIIGYYLAGAKFSSILRNLSAYIASTFRLIVFPMIFVLILYLLRDSLDRTMMLALVIPASAPVGAMVTMFAAKHNRDVDLSVGLVSGTTILSIITMPIVIAIAMEIL
jgi:predicted permease